MEPLLHRGGPPAARSAPRSPRRRAGGARPGSLPWAGASLAWWLAPSRPPGGRPAAEVPAHNRAPRAARQDHGPRDKPCSSGGRRPTVPARRMFYFCYCSASAIRYCPQALLVDGVAQAGLAVEDEVALLDPVGLGQQAVVALDQGVGVLQAVEVGDGLHHVGPGDEVSGPHGVVGRDGDVVGLGHGGDLLQLGDAPGPDDVRHDVVGQAPLKHGQELPAGVQALADADGAPVLVAHLAQGVVALRRDGLLEPADAVGGQACWPGGPRWGRCSGRGRRSGSPPRGPPPRGRRRPRRSPAAPPPALICPGLVLAVVRAHLEEGVELAGAVPAGPEALPGGPGVLLRGAPGALEPGVAVEGDALAEAPPEELVDRLPQRPAP